MQEPNSISEASLGQLLYKAASFLVVGALWGCSNAVLKQTTAEGTAVGTKEPPKQADSTKTEARSYLNDILGGLKSLLKAKVSLWPHIRI
jgi:hypothetical protein